MDAADTAIARASDVALRDMAVDEMSIGETVVPPTSAPPLFQSTKLSSPASSRHRRAHPKHVRYWNDESYAKFYESSREEQRVLRNAAAGAGLTNASSAKAYTAWQIHGHGAPHNSSDVRGAGPLGRPSDGRIARFQHAFAELSGGRGWVRSSDVHALFRAMGLDFTAEAIRELLQGMVAFDNSSETLAHQISYDTAFQLYRQALSPTPGSEEAHTAIEDALQAIIADDAVAFGVCEVVQPPGRKWSRPASVQDDAPRMVGPAAPKAILAQLEEKRVVPHASLYQPPLILDGKARGASIFKQVGRFRLSPAVFAA